MRTKWHQLLLACIAMTPLLLTACGGDSKSTGGGEKKEEEDPIDVCGPPPADPKEKLRYFKKKGNAGDADSMFEAAKMYLSGAGTSYGQEVPEEAKKWFEKAANAGHAEAAFALGNMFDQGTGAKKRDFAQARIWWEKAGELGNTDAMFANGNLYYTGYREAGKLTPADKEAAKKWFEMAGSKGHARAANNLAVMWEKGEVGVAGSEDNINQAIKWYQVAAAKGHPNAQNAVKRLKKGDKEKTEP